MHPKKLGYSKDILYLVKKSCAVFSHKRNPSLRSMININHDEAFYIIKKIMIALPDHFFYNANKKKLNDMIAFIAKNFILFQSQEEINGDHYAYNLINFIDDLTSAIGIRYYQSRR